jgi:hypothetical protein
MRVRESFLLVALIWSLLPAFGALPLYLHIDGLSWTDAYFEAVSGLDGDRGDGALRARHLPLSINFWRTFMHWVGGLGVVVLAVAILPLLGFGGRSMLKAETPGPMKDSKITPRMTETAKGLWVVYVILTAACGVSLHQAGMLPWDALMHAFSIMGLGGFRARTPASATSTASRSNWWSSSSRCSPASTSARTSSPCRSVRCAPIASTSKYTIFSAFLALSSLALTVLPVAGRSLRRFSDDVSLRRLPLRVAGHIAWLRHHRLRPVAVVRAVVDPVSSAASSPVPVRPAAASR